MQIKYLCDNELRDEAEQDCVITNGPNGKSPIVHEAISYRRERSDLLPNAISNNGSQRKLT